MTLEIPNERQDEREEHLHEEEKAKHIKDRRGEYYQERREDLSHDADRYDRTLRDEIHFAEKGERREPECCRFRNQRDRRHRTS